MKKDPRDTVEASGQLSGRQPRRMLRSVAEEKALHLLRDITEAVEQGVHIGYDDMHETWLFIQAAQSDQSEAIPQDESQQ